LQLAALGMGESELGISGPIPEGSAPSLTFYTKSGCSACTYARPNWIAIVNVISSLPEEHRITMRTVCFPGRTEEEQKAILEETRDSDVTKVPMVVARVGREDRGNLIGNDILADRMLQLIGQMMMPLDAASVNAEEHAEQGKATNDGTVTITEDDAPTFQVPTSP